MKKEERGLIELLEELICDDLCRYPCNKYLKCEDEVNGRHCDILKKIIKYFRKGVKNEQNT